ncbi:MAG: TAXI family TRAP transporter solute-binding subunit [Cyclobacteriaceae bacterium]
MKANRLLFLLPIVIVLISCNEEPTNFRIIYSADEPIGQIAKRMEYVLDKNDNITTELIIGPGSIGNVDSLLAGAADLAIIENHTPVDDSISSVLPFYPQILHILYQSDEEITDFKELVAGKKVFMGFEGSGTYRFMLDLFQFFEIDKSEVEITDNPFDFEVYASFGDIIKDDNLRGLRGFRLYSFDHIDNFKKGSIAEAICLKYPQMRPFIIPQNTYRELTPNASLTIAVDAVLVARTEISTEAIYQLTKTLFQNHQEFNSISPLIYLDLTENFDHNKLNFPLHPGSRRYLDRDEPGFFERYAEVIGVGFSVLIALISGLISLSKWREQVKKDRIDIFYKKVIDIKSDIPKLRSSREAKGKILELQTEQDKAFQMLIDERLLANESFRIYMELNKEIIQSLVARTRAFRKMEMETGKMRVG